MQLDGDSVNLQAGSSGSTVLVLTEPGDTTADLVVKELHNRDAQVFRADTGDFPLSLQVSAYFDGQWHGQLRSAHGSVELTDIRSIYIRRPKTFILPPEMSDAEQRFATREARRGIGGLLMSLPCSWVNHPSRTADAEYKPFQLHAAAACGLRVPRTVVTNVPEDAGQHHAFLGSSVYKALASAAVSDGDRPSIIYTTDVTSADMADSRVLLTAHQFQQRIPKVRDVRATVVGTQVFAVNIFVNEEAAAGGLLDWRSDYTALRYEPTSLPAEVEASLLAVLGRLGLSFAAADFVVTADGQYYFVDLNPNGEWGWIQEATGLPIAAAIATELTGDTL